ncbi:MAG: type IV toxin-antitoxin system AbiEi family antitoxin domain-containing protein [Actinomycetota bacterium]
MNEIELSERASLRYGLITLEDARRAGLKRGVIEHRVRTGRWIVVRRGVYVIAGVPKSWEQTLLAIQLGFGDCSLVSYRAAARLHGIYEAPAPFELSVPFSKGFRSENAVHVHRVKGLARVGMEIGPFRVTDPYRTLIDLAGVVDLGVLEGALDLSLRKRIVRLAQLKLGLGTTQPRGHPGIGSLRQLVEARDGSSELSESHLETRFLKLVRSGRLPMPVPQYVIKDRDFYARVDFAYPDVKMLIECDGYAFHSSRSHHDADRRRDRALADRGWTVRRYTYSDICSRGNDVIGELRRLL